MEKKHRFSLLKIFVLLAAVLLAMFPVSVLADEQPGGDVEENGMHAGKHIQVEDNGTYTIDLDAYATGEAHFDKVTVPADIILVLDVSGSMDQQMSGASYEYTPRESQAYSYSSYGNNTYYFKDSNGNYHAVSQNTNGNPTRYYLRYGTSGNRTYLTGTGTSNSRPGDAPTNQNATIWTGVLYERTTKPAVSKIDALKTAVNTFIDEVATKNAEAAAANPDAGNAALSRISIVKFAVNQTYNNSSYADYKNNIGDNDLGGYYEYNYTQVVADLGVVKEGPSTTDPTTTASWKAKVNGLHAAGSTAADYGMGYADAIISEHSNDYNYTDPEAANYRSRVVVMFTDGEPTYQTQFQAAVANATITAANTIKHNNTTVYTVAVYNGADPSADPTASGTTDINKYLHAVSSNYPEATSYTPSSALGDRATGNYYFAAESADQLEAIFKEIGQSSGSTTTEVGSEAVMKDIISNSFTLPEHANESDIHVKIVRWNSTTHAWGTGEGYEFTPEQWETECLNYGAETAETVSASISDDGKTVDITGFDYSTHFKATSTEQDDNEHDVVGGVNKNTAKIVVSFPIQARPSAVTGGSVATNGEDSGLYVDGQPIIKFEVPVVEYTPVTYVVDYVTSDTTHDTKASSVTLEYKDVLGNVEMLDDPSDDYLIGEDAEDFNYTIFKGRYGTISFGDDEVDVQRRYVRYAPTTMNWDGYDRIFVKGDSATESNLDVWAMLCVLPANSVFYEDTYITQTKTVTYNGQEVTIEYTGINYDEGKWNTVGTEGKNQTYHAGDDMGWIKGLADDSTYANDMAHITNTAKAKATFTFSGTGVDIYSRTNGSTGTCTIKVVSAAEENESGKKISKAQIIDTKAAAGDFFAIPVCTFTDLPYGKYTATITVTAAGQKEGRMTFYLDGVRVYNPIKPLEDDENVIQIYGEKNLGAVFTEVRSMLGTDANAEALYLDEFTTSTTVTDVAAIEAAAQALAEAQQARDAYVEAEITPAKNAISEAEYALESAKAAVTNAQAIYEANPTPENLAKLESAQQALAEAQATYDSQIEGLEDALEAANAGKTQYDDAVNAAIAAYDEANDGVDVAYSEATIAQYEKEGPNSEVYLDDNQQVAINVESGKYYYIGLKSLKGDDVTAEINGKQVKLNHTTDLYYEATPASGNIITIKNVSAGILSITKLRTTGVGNKTKGTRLASSEETLAYVRNFEAELVANSDSDYTGEILTEEEAGLERIGTTEAEMTVESLEESDITIENPETDVTYDELKNALNKKSSSLSKLMSSFSRFLGH